MAAPLQRLFAGRVMHFISGQPGAWGSLRAVHSAITSQQQPAVLADGAAAPQPVPASPASPASQQATSGQTETAAETTSAQVEAAAGTVPLHEPPPIASWMYRHIKQKGNISMADYLERKRKSWWSKLGFWEKFWYYAGLLGAAVVVYMRIDWDGKKAAKAEEERLAVEALEAKRLEALPSFMTGEEDQPFEGASPAEIMAMAEKYKMDKSAAGVSKVARWWDLPQDDDPFDGMSPEEIDAHYATKEADGAPQ